MQIGLVAFLDVLGFSSLVSGDSQGNRLQEYLNCLKSVLEDDSGGPKVEYVVFSDNIVLTTPNDSKESLKAIVRHCSRILYSMLDKDIPLRGAIAHGSFVRNDFPGGVFVAGKSIIEAYRFEKAQDWIGIMLAPSVVRHYPGLEALCTIEQFNRSSESYREFSNRFDWSAFLQKYHSIPFHSAHTFDNPSFDGYAIVPTNGIPRPEEVRVSIDRSIEKLKWLKSFAPDPSSQDKYQRSEKWWREVVYKWHDFAFWLSQQPNKNGLG